MNWVTRAKESLLGASFNRPPPVTEAPPPPSWDSLSAIDAAINERLTGSPERHPAAQACLARGSIQRCLVMAATGAEAAKITDSLTAQNIVSNDAIVTCILMPDRPFHDTVAALLPSEDFRFDAALVVLPRYPCVDFEGMFSWLNDRLAEHGVLWLHATKPAETELGVPTNLVDSLLQQVPSRWRSEARFRKGTPRSTAMELGRTYEGALRSRFSVESAVSRGGSLLAPLFAAGCIAPEMNDDPEGRALLRALYLTESDLIERGEIAALDTIYVASPRADQNSEIARLFDTHAGAPPAAGIAGMSGSLPEWIRFNLTEALNSARAADHAAPFPPDELMYHTTGLKLHRDFAQHGADILRALAAASPSPLNERKAVLDFGVGVGRVGRYFKGFSGRYVGVDIDHANVAWVSDKLPWIEAIATKPAEALPFDAATFDCVVSISVFTHIDQQSTEFYIDELHRVTQPGALLFLTLHGESALERGLSEERVSRLMGVSTEHLEHTKAVLLQDGFAFAEQYTHLTQDNYRYGTTFVSQARAEAMFGRRFAVHRYVPAAIHAFQDLIVLERA